MNSLDGIDQYLANLQKTSDKDYGTYRLIGHLIVDGLTDMLTNLHIASKETIREDLKKLVHIAHLINSYTNDIDRVKDYATKKELNRQKEE